MGGESANSGMGQGFGSSSSQSSVDSPDIQYHYAMQNGPLPPLGESPTSHHQNLPLYSMHGDQFIHTPQQSLYNNPNANTSTDFSPFPDNDPQSSAGVYDNGPYRSNTVTGPYFSSRTRQSVAGPSSAIGNEHNGNGFQYNLSSAEVFGTHQSIPAMHQQQQGLNGVRGYEFGNEVQTLKQNGKPIFSNMDPFNTTAAAMLQNHQLSKLQAQQQLHNLQTQFSSMNNMLQPQSQALSQTPFGPHVSSNGSGMGVSHSNGVGTVSVMNQQEEISTIFVVGFPDDMQEREFQNMFTFSPGFEAATLKIPNKDSTAYGSTAPTTGTNMNSAGRGAFQLGGYPYSGANDPYNLVTVNQGGVVVDGRDGTTSWPEPSDLQSGFGSNGNQQGQGPIPPRKQIIGFAKFRTRAEALAARDLLQGRRVDIEKGAVLKAEMAKKNLHTKRGVGPVGVQPLVSGSTTSGMLGGLGNMGNSMNSINGGLSSVTDGLSGMSGMLSPGSGPGETLSARERELGALGAMGLGNVTRRDRLEPQEEERERENRRRRELGSVSSLSGLGALSMLGSRGPRERIEEEERDRRRKEKDAERSRLRAGNQAAYDAFHSVSMGPNRNPSMASTVLSPSDSLGGYPFPNTQGFSPQETIGSAGLDGWPSSNQGVPRKLTGLSINGGLRSMPIGIPTSASNVSTRPPSSHESSPSDVNTDPTFPASFSSQSGVSDHASGLEQDQFNVGKGVPLSSRASGSSLGSRSRPYSPTNDTTLQSSGFLPPLPEQLQQQQQQQQQQMGQTQGPGSAIPVSSSSSISGSRSSTGSVDEELTRAMGGFDLGSQQGTISPQLPSPNSGASSGSGVKTNASDQNPPINTLYVGNLPTSQLPGNQPTLLEDTLRQLFSKCLGYRKLCYRQKSNGPMCFVEFEDVSYATKALNDLYGHSLNGLVKGGIRLSYSKNPLGVRTPTNGMASNGLQQQLHQSLPSFASAPSFSTFRDSFAQPRQTNGGILSVDMNAIRGARRDQGDTLSPSYQFATSPPPTSRFVSPPPSLGYQFSHHPNSSGLARSSSQGFTSSFSPFGSSTPPNMTPQLGPSDSEDILQPSNSSNSMPPSSNLDAPPRAG